MVNPEQQGCILRVDWFVFGTLWLGVEFQVLGIVVRAFWKPCLAALVLVVFGQGGMGKLHVCSLYGLLLVK